MRGVLKTSLLCACMTVMASAVGARPSALTIEDAIQTTRLMVDRSANPVFVSPDRKRYVAMLIRGDVSRDGVEVELVSGDLGSLQSARPRSVAKLFSRGLGERPTRDADLASLTLGTQNPPVWLDNEEVAFYWVDEHEVRQVVGLNVTTRRLRFLTQSPTDVTAFGAGPNGELLYRATIRHSLERSALLLQDGFRVTSPDAFAMFIGFVDGTGGLDLGRADEWFLITPAHPNARKLDMPDATITRWPSGMLKFSPDGRYALIDAAPARIPPEWFKYTRGRLGEVMADIARNPDGWDARQLQQFFVVDIQAGTARPLWNAPVGWNISPAKPPLVEWSQDSRYLALGNPVIPGPTLDAPGVAAKAIVEVEVSTGKFRYVNAEAGQSYAKARKEGGGNVRVELRQSPNDPPRLYAVEIASGREQLVLDPNPVLTSEFTLGRVQVVRWQDAEGREWKGRLYYPVGHVPGRRYPLVIQTNISAFEDDSHFSLYGMGGASPALGPGWAAFIAQPLANRGIMVMEALGPARPLPEPTAGNVRLDLIRPYVTSYAEAAEHFSAKGLVDRERVGLMGYSNRGWHVEYALSFSDFPFAAAIASDNISAGYLGAAFSAWSFALGGDLTGAQPFAEGFEAWLENSPTFNAHRVRTPLMLQVTDSFGGIAAPVVHGWESFSRLRYLRKPVELYVAPNILRGSHGLQNPTQVLDVQERSLDWWLFWLKGEEDKDPSKAVQYASWRKLRDLHRAELKVPRPPRLDWSVQPAD